MKMQDLSEMTLKAGDLSNSLNLIFQRIKREHDNFEHIGDIGNIKVLQNENFYLLEVDEPIGFFEVLSINDSRLEIRNAFIDQSQRGNNLFEKFVWFLKRILHFKEIQLGDIHSQDTVALLKKLSLRFDISWEKGSEKEKYSPEKADNFYSVKKPTGWKIVLENDGDFSSWPRFNKGVINGKEVDMSLDVRSDYSWVFND